MNNQTLALKPTITFLKIPGDDIFQKETQKCTGLSTQNMPTLRKDQRKTPLVSHTRNFYLCTFIKGGDVLQTGEDGALFQMSAS